mmetsp:Transcript_4190/g.12995  ORF Transcript_4190/g.12995 Transcript_4190/m.12995 type:complete len:215 (+) Transcript_4190:661-1305(+)
MKSSGPKRSRKRGWMPVPRQLSQTTTPRPSQLRQTFSETLMGYLERISSNMITSLGPVAQSSILTTFAAVKSPVACRTPRTREASGSTPEPLQIVHSTTFSPLHSTHGCALASSSLRLPAFSVKEIRAMPPKMPPKATPTPSTVFQSMPPELAAHGSAMSGEPARAGRAASGAARWARSSDGIGRCGRVSAAQARTVGSMANRRRRFLLRCLSS